MPRENKVINKLSLIESFFPSTNQTGETTEAAPQLLLHTGLCDDEGNMSVNFDWESDYWVLNRIQSYPQLGKSEALTILRRNENYKVNFRIPRHLPGQPESARSGQLVGFSS